MKNMNKMKNSQVVCDEIGENISDSLIFFFIYIGTLRHESMCNVQKNGATLEMAQKNSARSKRLGIIPQSYRPLTWHIGTLSKQSPPSSYWYLPTHNLLLPACLVRLPVGLSV
jgi:hypothetical protein